MNIKSASGLEYLQAIERDELPMPPVCHTVPMTIVEVELSRASSRY
ncbi:MAG: hypothetical protein OQL27_12860 [Sedimenticola sp.]|nr:hypothetical protein [Sedimenticola sp.]